MVKPGRTLEIERKIFSFIILMRTNRILCYLGLIPKSNGKKNKSIQDILQMVLGYYSTLPFSHTPRKQLLRSFIEDARHLENALYRFQVDQNLGRLVESIYRLEKADGTSSLISEIPSPFLTPTLGKAFIDMLSKVAMLVGTYVKGITITI